MTEPSKTFVGKTSAELHMAGLTWLERAARLALDDGFLHAASPAGSRFPDKLVRELDAIDDRLRQQRNIAEAQLAAQIGHSLIMAGLADNDADGNPHRYYGAGSESSP